MTTKPDPLMSLDEVVEHVMKTTGRTRRQAKQEVLRALKSGQITATGERVAVDPSTGEEVRSGRAPIPVGVWRDIPSEH